MTVPASRWFRRSGLTTVSAAGVRGWGGRPDGPVEAVAALLGHPGSARRLCQTDSVTPGDEHMFAWLVVLEEGERAGWVC